MAALKAQSKPISDVRLGRKKLYPDNLGDTWDPTWAEDGSLYYPGNDGSGWNKACSSNLFFNRSSGDDPFDLQSLTTNAMLEYDGWAKRREDGCTWKSSGCISVNGTLYLAFARHAYGTQSGDPHLRQTARRASIIQSTDHGQTWTRSAEENYHQPMFDPYFTTPYFIHYGQDGLAPAVDDAQTYLYAISNNGFWCNGDHYILGRVARAKISQLNPSDWSFYRGDGSGDDKQNAQSWTSDASAARPIIENPLKCGETGATYIQALGRYLLAAWYYPGDPNIDTDESRLIYYEAPHPWGPWTMVKEDVIRPEGWYCPRVLSKWQTPGENEVETILVASGDYYEMSKYYRFIVSALSLKTGGLFPPEPAQPARQTFMAKDPAVDYHGSWQFDNSRAKAASRGEYFSQTPGDTLTISFSGTRLEWHTSKENCLGIAAVSIDDSEETEIDLWTYCHVPQYQRLVFDSGPLQPGQHNFKVRLTGKKNEKSTGVGIFHDHVEVIVH